MQAIRIIMNEDNRFITYSCVAHRSNTLTPYTQQVDYSAINREITETIDEENMLNQLINKIGFMNLLQAREMKPSPF